MKGRADPAPAALLVAALLAAAVTGCADQAPRRWSVLLISIDTLRPDYLGINGYPRPTSPYLDRLLATGRYFEGAVAPIPRTTPALASLLTGAYPHVTGVRRLIDRLSDEVVPFPEVLAADGYQTVAVVTNQAVRPERRLDRGFQVYDWAGDTRAAPRATERALALLDGLDPSRPALVWVHYLDPHMPYHPNRRLASMMDPGYRGRYRWNFGWQPQPGEPPSAWQIFPRNLPKPIAVHRNRLPGRVNEHIRRLYAAGIRLADEQIARVVDRARELYGDSLIVVVVADHGESLGEHDFYFDHGDYVYNPGLRVPLGFVLPPTHPLHGAGRCSGWVSLVDVAPTLFDLLERPWPESMAAQREGRSLAMCFGEELEAVPVFAESGHSYHFKYVRRRVANGVEGRFRAVISGRFKLVWTPLLADDQAWELYDLEADPGETRNLWRPDHPALPDLRVALDDWLARATDVDHDGQPTDEDLEGLRALGYVE